MQSVFPDRMRYAAWVEAATLKNRRKKAVMRGQTN
jgi:hypothetical protein